MWVHFQHTVQLKRWPLQTGHRIPCQECTMVVSTGVRQEGLWLTPGPQQMQRGFRTATFVGTHNALILRYSMPAARARAFAAAFGARAAARLCASARPRTRLEHHSEPCRAHDCASWRSGTPRKHLQCSSVHGLAAAKIVYSGKHRSRQFPYKLLILTSVVIATH